MVTVTATGELITDPSFSTTQSGVQRCNFVIRCDEENSLPLHLDVSCFSRWAEQARQLTRGMRVLVNGRFTAGTKARKISLSVSRFEVLSQPANIAPEGQNETGESHEIG